MANFNHCLRNAIYNVSSNPRHKKKNFRRRMKRQKCTVYGLYDGSGQLQYIGQTRIKLNKRLKWYRTQINRYHRNGWKLTPVLAWISDCRYREDPVVIKAIDTNATWDVSEIIYIERARQAGCQLLNVLRGGSDTPYDFIREKHGTR